MRGLSTCGATSPAKRAGRIATGTGPHPDCCRSFQAAQPSPNLLTRHRHLVLLSVVLLGTAAGNAQDGYTVAGNRLTVSGDGHWRDWLGAVGGYLVEEGEVRPRYLRRGINAMLNATDFEVIASGDTIIGGVRQVGTGRETAALVMDGDPLTYWEPVDPDSLQNWFIEVDLGRAVIADRVRVQFADEGAGDPFLKFRVLMSNGRASVNTASRYDAEFYRVAQVTRRNKEQREFEFEVPLQRPLPPGVAGEVAQIVRLEALDTDGPRGEEVTGEEYALLSDHDRGAVEHFRQTVAAREILVDEETWGELPDEEQGPVRYYRHERPRVAELEVITLGDNAVGLTQRLRNRATDLFEDIVLTVSTDGLYSSFYPMRLYDPLRNRNQLLVDLGAKFWIDRLRLLSAQDALTAYQLRVSDGSVDPNGNRVWEDFEERHNREAFLQLEERFPAREVRLIELRRLELSGARSEINRSLSELQAYGEGFVSEVVLESPIIKLGTSRIFTGVSWDGEAPEGTRLEVRSRSGDDLLEVKRYYDLFGREISEQQWDATAERNRGFTTSEEFPGEGWSAWSEPYREQGEPFRSPGPRRMLMLQVRLSTADPLRAASIRGIELGLEAPLVEQTFAEIWPNQGVRPGREEEFAIWMRPEFQSGDSGFDRMRLRSSSAAPIELVSLQSGSEAQLRGGRGRSLWPGGARIEALEEGGVVVELPQRVSGGSLLYRAEIRTQVFLSGTTFTVELLNSQRPGVVQAFTEGDASSDVRSESMVVVADVEDAPILENVRAEPALFTPNGDGVNEATRIRFSVFRIKGERDLRVGVYDLSGRKVRDLGGVREIPSGQHAVPWDGRDDEGRRVGPGLYLVRVSVPTDADAAGSALAAVGVVY